MSRSNLPVIWTIILLVACFATPVFLGGCAAGHSSVLDEISAGPEAGTVKEKIDRDTTVGQSVGNRGNLNVVRDGTGAYKILTTPYGYIKQRIQYHDGALETPSFEQAKMTRVMSLEDAKRDSSSVSDSARERRDPVPGASGRDVKDNVISEEPVRNKAEASGNSGKIVLNFDDADLFEVIRTMADILNMNYIMDPNIQGKVTIHTAGELKQNELLSVFFQILELNGLTAVKRGDLHCIVKLKGVGRMSIVPRYGTDAADIVPEEKVVIQIIPLKYISTQEMMKVLTPFISPEGTIISHDSSNTLIVVDKGFNILKVLRMTRAFDIDVLKEVKHRFFPLRTMGAKEAAEALKQIFSAYMISGKAEARFIPIERLNMVLAISSAPQVLDKVSKFIFQLDADRGEVNPRIFVYFVKNGEAKQLSDILKQVFEKDSSRKETGKKPEPETKVTGNPFSKKKTDSGKETPAVQTAITGSGSGSETLRGEVKITPDEVRNALVIEAVPSDYDIIKRILGSLDVLPRQVLIECTIAEIKLEKSTDLGIEWSYTKDVYPGSGLLKATMGEGGLEYSVGIANRIKADISAFAKDGRVNILSSPHILASDNKEAKIDISEEIPVASSTYEDTDNSNVISTNIEYRDTGIILTVTPHINDSGIVSMDVEQEVSELSGDLNVAGNEYPTFFKRRIDTYLTVKHGQTIVIGGLIRSKESDTAKGTPWLVDIPVIRYLFGKESTENHKTELIVLLTPRVVTSLDDVEMVTDEFKRKVKNATRMIAGESP
jgi:general secretion pathway protein D